MGGLSPRHDCPTNQTLFSPQDLGVVSLTAAHQGVYNGTVRFEIRSASAQKEGGVHDLHSFTRQLFA
jgi:IMP dehydrogenase